MTICVGREKVNWPKGPREAGLGRDLGARKSVGASGRPRPTWSAPFVGADVPIGPRRIKEAAPYEDGALSVIARRAAGPTRQSVFPREKDGFPRPLRGLGMTGRRGQAPAPTRLHHSVGAHSVRPRAATWGRPYES